MFVHVFCLQQVYPNLGLCISLYEILSIEGGTVYQLDGAATFSVKFRLVRSHMCCAHHAGCVITIQNDAHELFSHVLENSRLLLIVRLIIP